MNEVYLIKAMFDDDEELFDEVIQAYKSKAKAEEVCEVMNTARTALNQYEHAFDKHVARWAKAHKKPTFKPRIGALTEDQKEEIKLEKEVWKAYKDAEDVEKARYREENYPNTIVNLNKEAVDAINVHLYHVSRRCIFRRSPKSH